MISKRLFITAVVISLLGHMAILALTGLSEATLEIRSDRIFKVRLEKDPKNIEKKSEEREKIKKNVKPEEPTEEIAFEAEDTVNLDSTDTRYHSYLAKIKGMVERKWSYPSWASTRREKGTTIVKFSITDGGILSNATVLSSSGYASLDIESLYAIKSAAPFPRLPESFHLSRLNIVAKFNYTLSD
ncbi:MAG: energy transducer TonB [Thermodesulfobacteriota bacterium]|nr:energy transducer TonB [Thermodesulfobacteriota bacterium]